MDNFDFDFDSKVPGIAKGTVPPPMVEKMIDDAESKEEKEAQKEHRQFRHDWRLAIFTTLVGALLSRPIWSGLDLLIAKIISG